MRVMGKIFVDIDNVIINTIEIITSLYNDDYSYYKNFQKINWHDIETWEFSELKCAKKEDIDRYFNQPRFFREIVYMDRAKEILQKLSKQYDIYAVSMGTKTNLKLKEKWLSVNLPFVEFIGVNSKHYKDKSHICMDGHIFIDDSERNLRTSDALMKICFGDVYDWNKGWTGTRCYNWCEIEKLLLKRSMDDELYYNNTYVSQRIIR